MEEKLKCYQNKAEEWSLEKCKRIAKRKCTDAFGTQDHLPGLLKGVYGYVLYNGGCIRNGKLYESENLPLPIVPEGFKIIWARNWGYRLIEIKAEEKTVG